MKHKHAELLHYAAENADARFKCFNSRGTFDIDYVLERPEYNWQIVKAPVVEVRYYYYHIGDYTYSPPSGYGY